eukprot:SAG11_NODE_19498_length_465_cov_1.275956_2_plen_71_part_01
MQILCVVSWMRLLGVLLLHNKLGPLVTMVLQMNNDILVFTVLVIVFICGFGTGIIPLGFDFNGGGSGDGEG